jgi:hypothetical protein
MEQGFILQATLEYPDGRTIVLPSVHNRLQATFNVTKAGLISGKDTGIVRYIEVGSGDPSWDAAPPPPDPGTAQTGLLAAISRVGAFTNADWAYLDGAGVVTGTPTGTVQLTATIGIGSGNGTLRECALWAGTAASATIGTGSLANIIRFVAIPKPSGGSDFNLVLKVTIAFT